MISKQSNATGDFEVVKELQIKIDKIREEMETSVPEDKRGATVLIIALEEAIRREDYETAAHVREEVRE